MEKNRSNKNILIRRSFLLILISGFILSACNPTKYVPQEETLLDENRVAVNKEGIKKADLIPYIRQKPNKKIFGAKFHLGLYNLSKLEKSRWPHGWLREIGEEPVIFDPYATDKSTEQIQSYIASKGFFDSKVLETIETANRKSKVYYNVDLKSPYTIRNLHFNIGDDNIRNLYNLDSLNCMIEVGKPYDMDVLQAERIRFERLVKDHGFYNFSSDFISFGVDSTVGNRQVDIYYNVKDYQSIDGMNRQVTAPYPMYRIRNVFIYPDFVPRDALEGGDEYFMSLDTTEYRGYYFISPKDKPTLKYDLIIQALYLKPGSVYNLTNNEQTQSHLLSLKTFRLINIFYNELPGLGPGQELGLNCNIQLTMLSQQSFKVELEGTNSAGNLGGALNLIYQHKNLFRGAELFNLKLKGAYEALSQQYTGLKSAQEYGVETSLRFPKFLLPFLEKEQFIKKYSPTTNLLAAYNYQEMPLYTRTMANATFGYNWNSGSYSTHIINPVQLNVVKLDTIDPEFQKKINSSSFLAGAYRDVIILGGNYSYIFSNQTIRKSKDFWFFRFNAEASGNIPSVISKLTGSDKTDDSYNLFGQPYAQYIRTDIDLRYNVILNDVSSMVYRGFAGIGVPYGNSKAIPFEKQYFGGGANGIRAWQVRTLGPGSFVPDDSTFLNQTADIKLEFNTEYRFKLFWILEGAVFVDAGNIWSIRNDITSPGSQFKFNSFLNDIAVGTGAGLRLDLSFITLRADLGMKLRDPWIDKGSKWIISSRPYNLRDDFTLVVAIGYPF